MSVSKMVAVAAACRRNGAPGPASWNVPETSGAKGTKTVKKKAADNPAPPDDPAPPDRPEFDWDRRWVPRCKARRTNGC